MKIDINLGKQLPSRFDLNNIVSDNLPDAFMDLEELLATRLLVQGNSGSGKSHLLRRLLEKSAEWVQQCIIDPEGDFVTLSEKFGHLVIEAAQYNANELAQIAQRVRQNRISVVLNLEELEIVKQMQASAIFLNNLFEVERDYWYPMLIVVDEAQLFAPAVGGEIPEDIRKNSLSSMTNLMCRGRKRGLAGIIATQRLAKLAKNVAAEASNFLMGRTFLDIDMLRAADLLGMERKQAELFRELRRGYFVALGPALSRKPLIIKIGEVDTQSKSASPKLLPLPIIDQNQQQEMLFENFIDISNKSSQEKLVEDNKNIFTDIDKKIAEMQQQDQLIENINLNNAQMNLIDDYERQEKEQYLLKKICKDMVNDKQISYRQVAVLYQDFLVHCRINKWSKNLPDINIFRHNLSIAQAENIYPKILEDGKQQKWNLAIEQAEKMPEDTQAVFLTLVRAALLKEDCPSMDSLAKIYGTYSISRVKRLIDWFEKQDLLVLRKDFSGSVKIIFPDFDCSLTYSNGK
ncbi:helicase HerA domain-containing protein [Bartonella sp. DGB1]|uniref:helicase HerA domain-containing protein n=1 Tax=Bartonella sp. DGB1 TaxID=3239807 RepID=UPI003524098B